MKPDPGAMGTRVIGTVFISLDSVDSTNKYAADLVAQDKAPHGTVILAHEQTAGRGQRGRTWKSAKGLDLAASVVLRPDWLNADRQFILAQAAALAVHDVVAEAMRTAVDGRGEQVRIKWPNDVLIDRRKVAGILIQNELSGIKVATSIIGIGINVNSSELEAELHATSLRMETGLEQDLKALLIRLCQRLEHWLDLAEAQDPELPLRYATLLWSRNRFADMELDGAPYSARPMDVDPSGRLLVEDASGQVQAFGLDRLRFAAR
jgi:BirA family biotin operon repressor/biotin-[acetyl-CoA-carboxylase] ligase